MATASSSDDLLFCSLCLDVFKKPRCLFCGHSFCTKCLLEYINKNNDKQISCPSCTQSIQIPDSTKPVETWADQFPVNIALEKAISKLERSKISEKEDNTSRLRTVTDKLKMFKEMLQTEMEEATKKLRLDVAVSFLHAVDDVESFLRKEHGSLVAEIEKSRNFLNSEIDKLFTEHKHLIEENKIMIKLGEDLLQGKSESDIKIGISKFTKLQNRTSEFLDKSLSQIEKSEFKINLTTSDKKTEMPVPIAEISTSIQTNTQINRMTDTLKHTDTIETKQVKEKTNSSVFSILVSGENNNKIVVSDINNRCVKCLCLTCKSVINKHVTSSPPRGLAESRDEQGAVVVVAMPYKNENENENKNKNKNKILFLNLETFKQIRTIPTNKQYFCIAVLPGNYLAVSGWNGSHTDQYLDILRDDGQIFRSIEADLIPRPRNLTVQGQSLIVVSKRETVNNLVCVTSSYEVQWESRDSDRLKNLAGVTCDREGNIFVCDFSRNCVVQLSRDGEVLHDVITDQDGLSEPRCVSCHANKLYVALENGQIKIFSWCKK